MLALILLLACAPAVPELDTTRAACVPFQDQGAELFCGATGEAVLFCVQGDGCWYTDGNTVSVPVWDCQAPEAIAEAQQELVDRCDGLDW